MPSSETALDLCKELAQHWAKCCSEAFYVEESTKKRVTSRLEKLNEHIKKCNEYDYLDRPMAGEYAAADYGNSFMAIPGLIRRLRRDFDTLSVTYSDTPHAEEADLLNTLLNRTQEAVKKEYSYSDKAIPAKRPHGMQIRNEHPQYPVYPEGVLKADCMSALQNARSVLESVRVADLELAAMPPDTENPVKHILKKRPAAAMLIGTDEAQTIATIDHRLQTAYSEAYTSGVAALETAFGLAGAEDCMDKEANAIEVFFVLPKAEARTVA